MATKKTRKKREFSKIMVVVAVSMWILVNIFGLVVIIITLDTTPLAYIMPSIDAVVAIVLGFYYWKARAENQIKLKKAYGDIAPMPNYNDYIHYEGGIDDGV